MFTTNNSPSIPSSPKIDQVTSNYVFHFASNFFQHQIIFSDVIHSYRTSSLKAVNKMDSFNLIRWTVNRMLGRSTIALKSVFEFWYTIFIIVARLNIIYSILFWLITNTQNQTLLEPIDLLFSSPKTSKIVEMSRLSKFAINKHCWSNMIERSSSNYLR